MLRTHLNRSNEQTTCSVFFSSAATVWTNTKEASATEQLVPTPTLAFGAKRTGAMAYAGSIGAPPARSKPSGTTSAAAATAAESIADGAASASGAGKTDFADKPVSAPTIDAGAHEPIGALAKELLPAAETDSSKIHLSIDSLPNLKLIEAFPVTVTQLGDKLFTATVEALRLSGTSSTLGDALVTVKEEIVNLYDRLSKITRLDDDEKKDLKYLQSHIIPEIKLSSPQGQHKRRF